MTDEHLVNLQQMGQNVAKHTREEGRGDGAGRGVLGIAPALVTQAGEFCKTRAQAGYRPFHDQV